MTDQPTTRRSAPALPGQMVPPIICVHDSRVSSNTPSADANVHRRWLTRNVFAIGLLSLFSDAGHELTTALLPLFLATFSGSAAALGAIEGLSDAASSVLKLWMSFYSDRIGKRKPILAIGYLVTAMMGLVGMATAVWQIALIRVVAWMGRGARGPVRDALLSESVPPQAHGRAFGFESALDTVGAITVLIVLFILKDIPRKPQPGIRMLGTLQELPRSFWHYVIAVGIFGLGNFAHTLLILRAVSVLSPDYGSVQAGRIAIALYIFHNAVYAAASYPIGALGDRGSKKTLLAIGYALFALMCLGFLVVGASLPGLIALFALAGTYIAVVDSMERALAADLLPLERRATGYGALATVNSFGNLCSSLIVGLLWTHVSAAAGFWYAAVLTLTGAIALWLTPQQSTGRASSNTPRS